MKECIILAGGFGTRLQSVVSDVPKCMAEVAGEPFLHYLFEYLSSQSFDHIILSLGYKANSVIDWLKKQDYSFKTSYVIEEYPLGTGGAIKLAFEKVVGSEAFVINGDTFFNIETSSLFDFHKKKKAAISIALKPMTDFDRYGSVELDEDQRIVCFNEKEYMKEGLINGGVYIIDKRIFSGLKLPEKFSFENDILISYVETLAIYGCEQNDYFIDIGIPSDFEKANEDFRRKTK
ncbi:nucleotidyltransferase family protein [Dysgonomonas sp. Marseille-P4677]|uniref:nucleotidyltransferase family protein n=1 Tax=Dysgonomonas sp. Marseille-P4677 TaxID=2364790 RepID=UPI001912120B|nr:nucleotidyltransferase family protein [Dysgonomonas sp. Marseille-P4677]MBK5721484.1 nucleotidyltransferase family protein [Dysgonomonas sp. Marseille-P4677]